VTCRIEGCGRRHCVVCGNHQDATDTQTCIWCVGRVRRDLRTIVELYALLPAQMVEANLSNWNTSDGHGSDTNIPGGDALILAGNGNPSANGDRDVQPDDPEPILPLLAGWEDDWRQVRREHAAGMASMTSVAAYLDAKHAWAAQQHPAFNEYAADLARLRVRLEATLREGPQRSPIPCLTCERRSLERAMPRDDGRDIPWECAHCHRRYSEDEYWMAVRQHGQPV
jgi:hypothetical protein